MPKVSVCIPTYNTARYLPEAIESVLEQSFTDYELVICDNASTDQTAEICSSYDDPRIRYARFEEKTNQAGNFNRCLQEAQGEFITILHADDLLLQGFLADRVKRLEDREIGLVFGAVQIVDRQSAIISTQSRWSEDQCFQTGELVESLLFGCIVSPPSLMVRKECAEKAGAFRTDLTWGHDWEWTLRLAENSAACYASVALAAYRVHDESGTAEVLNAAENGHQERQILKETLARVSAGNKRFDKLKRPAFRALSRRHMYFAEQALLGGRRRAVLNNLWYAALADWSMILRPTFYALLLAAAGPTSIYTRYRALRNAAAGSEL